MSIYHLIFIPPYKVVPILQMRKARLRELISPRSLVAEPGFQPRGVSCKAYALNTKVLNPGHISKSPVVFVSYTDTRTLPQASRITARCIGSDSDVQPG